MRLNGSGMEFPLFDDTLLIDDCVDFCSCLSLCIKIVVQSLFESSESFSKTVSPALLLVHNLWVWIAVPIESSLLSSLKRNVVFGMCGADCISLRLLFYTEYL